MRIDPSLIDVLGGVREEDPEALEALIASIRAHNLLAPLVVVPHPRDPARYVLLAGRRRLAACQRLGKTKVKCLVRKSDDLQDEMIQISENYHRLDLTPAERAAQVLRYADLLRLHSERATQAKGRFPPPLEPANAAQARQAKHQQEEQASARKAARIGGTFTTKGNLRKHKVREPEVVKALVDQLGVSERTAQKVLRRADALTVTERETLIKAGVLDDRMDRICEVADVEKRAWICSLIAEGLGYRDAMATVLEGDFVVEDRDVSDQEFLDSLPLSTAAVNQKRFRSDALFYRKILKFRRFFQKAIDWEALKEEVAGTPGEGGLYYRRLKFFLEAPHPRDWVPCHGCHAGLDRGREHDACRGSGYLLG